MKKLPFIAILLAFGCLNLRAEVALEDWTEALNKQIYHGQTQVMTSGGTADILSEHEAVVLSTLSDAPLKITQLQNVVRSSGKRGVFVLILAPGDRTDLINSVATRARDAGLSVEVAQTLIESSPSGYKHTSQNKTSAATNSSTATTLQSASSEQSYWLNTKTGVRHNKNCRYYGKGTGRTCGPNEGRACKICGG
jgi:hypothetical protein